MEEDPLLITGDAYHEACPGALRRLALHRAVVALGDGAHQRQAQADTAIAFAGARQAIERLENALAFFRRNPRTVVAHAHHRVVALPAQLDGHGAAAVAAGV